jgi:hypothetical protein
MISFFRNLFSRKSKPLTEVVIDIDLSCGKKLLLVTPERLSNERMAHLVDAWDAAIKSKSPVMVLSGDFKIYAIKFDDTGDGNAQA